MFWGEQVNKFLKSNWSEWSNYFFMAVVDSFKIFVEEKLKQENKQKQAKSDESKIDNFNNFL